MKKDVENEIEELLAQIENKYKDQNIYTLDLVARALAIPIL